MKNQTGRKIALFLSLVVLVGCAIASVRQEQTKSAPLHERIVTDCPDTETAFNCVSVVEVYDGDTIFVNLPKYHPLFGRRIGVRVLGIDTPELRSGDPCEKAKGYEAKKALAALIDQAKRVDIINVQRDKYFRILGELMIDGQPAAAELIAQHLAYPYHGERKIKRDWCR